MTVPAPLAVALGTIASAGVPAQGVSSHPPEVMLPGSWSINTDACSLHHSAVQMHQVLGLGARAWGSRRRPQEGWGSLRTPDSWFRQAACREQHACSAGGAAGQPSHSRADPNASPHHPELLPALQPCLLPLLEARELGEEPDGP